MKKIIALFLLMSVMVLEAHAARLKDLADIEGVRGNELYGFGLVVGLLGTGDGKVDFTNKSVSNFLEKMGIKIRPEDVKVKNVAAVVVTATLPPFVRPGTKIDVTLSSLGDAKSLQGGTLLMSPLKGADGNVYALAQGEVAVGGYAVGQAGDAAVKNHPTVGVIAGGASVERAIPFDLFQSKRVRMVLREPDFTTITRMVSEINRELGRPLAAAVDSASVEIPLAADLARDPIGLIARLESLEVEQDVAARVIVNERTGTVIMGDQVKIGRVALAHGNLNIVVRSEEQVSQPSALSETGRTAVVTNTDITVGEDKRNLMLVGGQTSLGELVKGLNALGATPRDLISIFQALKKAGALHAELEIM